MRTRVYFEVRDAGPGMAPGVLKHVFEPFFTTKQGGHTGLGLPIVQEVAEGHGGSVQIESAPGKGTAVRLILPA
jgi:signal transduction histidine kinase